MFENILYQDASLLLSRDIKNRSLPGSILFSGPPSSGKLSAALETARVLSCQGEKKGEWNCQCQSCLHHKALVSQNVLIAGPGSRCLEIKASRETFLYQAMDNTSHLESSRMLFLRAVRKLTVRFSPFLWEEGDKYKKISSLLEEIDEEMEKLNPGRSIPENEELTKILDSIVSDCVKLEDSFLYKTLPVSQIRSISSWAHVSSQSGKKVVIIENADSMAEGSRNALLKILEEPPENVLFILTTANKGAMLATILSRVRNYSFVQRTPEQQKEVISRIFHHVSPDLKKEETGIENFLQTYLPVKPENVYKLSRTFFQSIAQGHVPDFTQIMQGCDGFSNRTIYKIFLQGIIDAQKKLSESPAGSFASAKTLEVLTSSFSNVNIYNQNPLAALEELTRSLLQINYQFKGIYKGAINE